MALCSSCNTANLEGAKFCAHCGKPLPAAVQQAYQPVTNQRQPSVAGKPPVSTTATSQPAQQSRLDIRAQHEPPQTPMPESATDKQAFQQKTSQHSPVGAEPDPIAPGQTQFFVAAAGVSTSSKIKRVVFFFVGAIIIGVVIFFGLRYALKVSSESVKTRVPSETTSSQSQTEAEPAAADSPAIQTADQPDQPSAKPDEKADKLKPTDGKPSKGN